jgi:hypothetical protein
MALLLCWLSSAGGRARCHQMNLAIAEAPAGIGIEPRQVGLGMKAPAGIGNAFGRAIEGKIPVAHAPFAGRHAVTIGAALQRGIAARMHETVLHHHVDRATKRVKPEHRIGAPHIHAGDGVLGNGVPVDGIAERLVQSHAILIDGQTLGCALKGRGIEAMEAQILVQAVALHVAEADTGGLCSQR